MKPRETRIALAAILLGHAAVGAVLFRFGTDLQDEGLLYVWARRLLDGQLPYTDFYLVQAPGTFYLQALLTKVFGTSLLVGRIFKQLQGLLIVYLSFIVARRATRSDQAGIVAAFATAVFSPALHFRMPWYGTDACICLLLAGYLACRFLEQRDRLAPLFMAGLALGFTTLFKQNHGVFGAAAIGAALAWITWREGRAGARAVLPPLAKTGSVLGAGFVLPIAAFLTYYVAAGGSLSLLWMNCFVWSSEAKDMTTPLHTLLYPLKIFALLHQDGWGAPITAIVLFAGVGCALARPLPLWARALGALAALATFSMGSGVLVRVYIWTFGSAVIFGTALATAIGLAKTAPTAPESGRANACFLVALVAAANLYGGTIPGGGWGRLVETFPGSLISLGVTASLLADARQGLGRLHERLLWPTVRSIGRSLAAVSLLVSAGLLLKNQAFRPKLDVELREMTAATRSAGWRGLLGSPTFVQDTDAIVDAIRQLPDQSRQSLFVYPLNCLLYPLADAKNPTSFDSHQVDFFAPSRFPVLMDELRRTRPHVVVFQRQPNAAFPAAGEPTAWTRPELREQVVQFIRAHYELKNEWTYYQIWTLRS